MSEPKSSRSALPASLAEVARAAGVSVATASKAINNRSDVNVKTRQRVLAIAEAMSFTPNVVAQGLSLGRTRSVGLVTNDISGRFAPAIMRGAENALGAESSSVFLCNTRGSTTLENHHVEALLGRRVEGLLVVGDDTKPRPPLQPPPHVPVVYVYAPSENRDDLSIVPDNEGAGRIATEHLLQIGKVHIAHIGGPAFSRAAMDRSHGTRQALLKARLEMVGAVPLHGDWLERWGWDATNDLLDNEAPLDGLVCGNDQIARGALDALIARRIRVPQDVAVVGFDNWEVLSLHGRNPISSVDMNLESLGAEAANALVKPEVTARTGVRRHPCSLMPRSSTV